MRRLGGFAWVSVLAMVASQICFIVAIKLGNTAEVFFLMSLAPLMAAVLARPLLGERVGALTTLAIVVALGGVGVMSGLSLKLDGLRSSVWESGWLARCLALGTAFSFALYLLATRGAQPQDLDAALVAVGTRHGPDQRHCAALARPPVMISAYAAALALRLLGEGKPLAPPPRKVAATLRRRQPDATHALPNPTLMQGVAYVGLTSEI